MSDRNKNIRNTVIVLALAVAVWKLPGGGTAAGCRAQAKIPIFFSD